MATVYDLAWLEDWASKQSFDGTNAGELSGKVFREVIGKFPDHFVSFGVTSDGDHYHITLQGQVIQAETVVIGRSV